MEIVLASGKINMFKALLVLFCAALATASLDITDQLDFELELRPRQTPTDLQVFTGALGGIKASAIAQSGDPNRPFEVDGDTFNDFKTAANRACDNQHNACADQANGDRNAGFKVGDCDEQNSKCKAAIDTATTTSFAVLFSSNAEFDFFCE
ncbi:hypothetical protein DL546_005230 [Coniochaeta pulveracea]|uniref:Uncharacterized protein n=1 Tax=Coniochaeta pulveracea TaxID=177199 RepID=A0A420Y6Y8_9PEZI|nr:hypothetical protein DL546_005230 [Coniochaeta pulveracea]